MATTVANQSNAPVITVAVSCVYSLHYFLPAQLIQRTITRLDETCREVRNAARIIGDPILFRKMEIASACIKRDVIFAGSLYIQ